MDADPYADQPSRGHELLTVQVIFLVLAGLATLVRAYVKVFMVKRVSLDDYLIFAAMALYLAYGSVAIDGVVNGATGMPPSMIKSKDQAVRSLKGWFICFVLYAPITMAVRVSVALVLLRITTKKVYRWVVWVNLAIIAVVSIVFFFILALQCSPPQYFWRQVYGDKGSCMDKQIVTTTVYIHSTLSAVSDWCLGLLPIPLLWHVKINRRTKVIVAFLLSLGMAAGVMLIVRMPYVTRLKPSVEFLYVSLDVAFWSVMEPALGIIAACIATYRPLFKSWGFGLSTSKKPTGVTNSTIRRRTGHWQLSSGRDGKVAGEPGVDPSVADESYMLADRDNLGRDSNKTGGTRVTIESVSSNEERQSRLGYK